MSNPDELWFEAREMAASWTESHRLERNRMAYSLIPFPETHDELCREADDTILGLCTADTGIHLWG